MIVGLIPGLALFHVGQPNGMIINYQTGYRGRTESMSALLQRRYLNTGTGTQESSRIYARGLGRQTDQAGHILARRLGGSGTDQNNLFPIAASSNLVMRAFEEVAALHTNRTGSVVYMINLNYESATATRPNLITVRLETWNTGELIFQDDLENP